jgi:chromosome segregation ATPase
MGDKLTAIEAASRIGKSANTIKRLAQIGRISSNKDDWNRTIVDMNEVQEYYDSLELIRPTAKRITGASQEKTLPPNNHHGDNMSPISQQAEALQEVVNELRAHVTSLKEERDRLILEVSSLKENLQRERDETRDANSQLKRMHQELWTMMTQKQLEASVRHESSSFVVDAEPVKPSTKSPKPQSVPMSAAKKKTSIKKSN